MLLKENNINDNHSGMKKASLHSELLPFLTKRYKWAVEYFNCIFIHKRYSILCCSPSGKIGISTNEKILISGMPSFGFYTVLDLSSQLDSDCTECLVAAMKC